MKGAILPTRLCRWGSSTGLRLPKAVLDCAEWKAGDLVYVRLLDSGDLLVRAVVPRPQANLEHQDGNRPEIPARVADEKW